MLASETSLSSLLDPEGNISIKNIGCDDQFIMMKHKKKKIQPAAIFIDNEKGDKFRLCFDQRNSLGSIRHLVIM